MKRAFTLIELLVVVAIIAILSAVSVLAFSSLQSRSRDSSRKESLAAYQISIEQYKASTGHYAIDKTYTVDGQSGGIAGYDDYGWGALTRTGTNSSTNSVYSLAEILQKSGYLTQIQTDPMLSGKALTDDSYANGVSDDLYYVTCESNGTTAPSPTVSEFSNSMAYALYAKLENPPTQSIPDTACGSALSGQDGTVDFSGRIGTPFKTAFNYSLGPPVNL